MQEHYKWLAELSGVTRELDVLNTDAKDKKPEYWVTRRSLKWIMRGCFWGGAACGFAAGLLVAFLWMLWPVIKP